MEFNEGLLFSKYMGGGYFIFVLLVGADFGLLASCVRLHKGGILFYFNHECTSNDEWGPGGRAGISDGFVIVCGVVLLERRQAVGNWAFLAE